MAESIAQSTAFEIHLEPSGSSGVHIFLMQDGNRVSSVSPWVPKALRDALQNRHIPLAAEKDFIQFLSESEASYPIYVHVSDGIVEARWDSSAQWGAKTRLEISGSRIRAQKVAADRQRPDVLLEDFVRVGEGLIVDAAGGRLMRLSDATGWYVADLLKEPLPQTESEKADELEYEIEYAAEYGDAEPVLDADDYSRPVNGKNGTAADAAPGFTRSSEPFEIPAAFFNEKKISYPKTQRVDYLKDLIFVSNRQPVEPQEAALTFRLTISRKPSAGTFMLRASSLWNRRPFELGEELFKYVEHLHSLRSAVLRKKKNKDALAKLLFALLSENSQEGAESFIEREVKAMELTDEAAEWEASEYLRRFFKTFALHENEQLLVAEDAGWNLVTLDFRKEGVLRRTVQALFEGDLFFWMETGLKEVPEGELFGRLKPLLSEMKSHGFELCFNQKSVQPTKLDFRVDTFQPSGIDWFQIHPKIEFRGRPLSEGEWRRLIEQKGILEDGEDLVVLDDDGLAALELFRSLLGAPSKKAMDSGVVRVPRLHILDWILLRRHGVEVKLSKENEELVERLINFSRIRPKAAPERFRGSLRDYQKEGYDWMGFLYEHRLGGCLADDMGLGKTVQAIAFLAGLKEKKIAADPKAATSPHLIVMPPTLIFNWRKEFENFYPDLCVVEYAGPERRAMFEKADVVLTSYEMIRADEDVFLEKKFHVIIFDEAQFMKNIRAKRTSSARRLKSFFTLTLTGTPLENHIGEYYSILDLSLPGLLGDYEDFRKRAIADGDLDRLKKRARPFVLRRTKSGTLKELPPKTENEVYLKMAPRQKALYQKVASKVRRAVDQAFENQGAGQASLSALTALLRLRQVCVSPQLLDPRAKEASPKVQYLLGKLRELVEEDHRALVFSQFTSFLDVVEKELQKEKIEYSRMDGSVPPGKRKAMIESFQCGAGAPIFLISLKTGGVGLNLTRASYVFHLDPWWNPAVENQASDRVHRIGQKKNVFVTRLLMQHTIEEKMVLLKKKKAALYRQVLDAGPRAAKPSSLTKEDFDFLLEKKGTR